MLIARRHGRWDEQQVAAHLMSCRAQMVCGLGRKPPWAGMDADTLDSCFGHGAALIASIAAQGQRQDWRTVGDLEKAQVAAFRNQAFDFWRRANTQSRRGDRNTVAFDPERHAAPDAQMDRLFEQPDLFAIRRDLLAEIDDATLLAFWGLVLGEGRTFKAAGDELGLTKAQVMARTRAGRALFLRYLDRRESGELCRDRGADVVARRDGTAGALQAERAAAHLDSCYACSLVHEPQRGAFERGILTVAPIGLLLRAAARASDLASVPATRWADAAIGARLAAGGLAAVAVAGSSVGLKVATTPERPMIRPAPAAMTRKAPVVSREAFRTPALLLARSAGTREAAAGARRDRQSKAAAPGDSSASRREVATPARAAADAPPPSPPATPEFAVENAPAAPVAAAPEPPNAAPPLAEFAGP